MAESQRYNWWDWHCSFMTPKIKCFACKDRKIYRKGEKEHGWGCTLIIRNGIKIAPNVVPICKSCAKLNDTGDLLDFMWKVKKTISEEQAEEIRNHLKQCFHTYVDNNDINEFSSHDRFCKLCNVLRNNQVRQEAIEKRNKLQEKQLHQIALQRQQEEQEEELDRLRNLERKVKRVVRENKKRRTEVE